MPLTAIIVDDSAVSRALLRAGLAKAGVETVGEASTAEHALQLYEEHNPSIAIFDIVLPQTDGITAATARDGGGLAKVHAAYQRDHA